MHSSFLKLLCCVLLSICLVLLPDPSLARSHKSPGAGTIDMASVNAADWQEKATRSVPLIIKLQVMLAWAHISPGEIDGTFGENTQKAASAFRQTRGLEPSDDFDEQLWQALMQENAEPPLTTYTINEKDEAGAFVENIPADFQKQADMDRLGYTSPEELLAEKFHMSRKLLRRLNPGVSFDKAGQEIVVANMKDSSLSQKIQRIEVDADKQLVLGYGRDDNVVAIYPATVGSDDRPTPEGKFKVTRINENPTYHYDPSLQFAGVHVMHELDIPPGPNNPVGAVWISLSAEGYGIHGTPDPDKISKSASANLPPMGASG
jgi:lipoprotein-anchoring transpeptidase ErfK/SrfK